jgi:thiol-disulfide isomerase/thioredoxin
MLKIKRIIILLVVSLTGLSLAGCGTGGTSENNQTAFVSGNGSAFLIPESQRVSAPILQGDDLNGKPIKLARNKVTVINFWASWCSPCRSETPLLADFAKKNPTIQFVGVLTKDEVSAARNFDAHFQVPYPSFADPSIILQFHGSVIPNAIPTTILLDSTGKIAARISGEVNSSLLLNLLSKISGGPVNA